MSCNNRSLALSWPGASYFRVSLPRVIISLMLLLSLIAIALFITGGFIRSTLGDVLVVIWLYCFLSSFINLTYRILIPASVLVAFVVEIAQYFKVAELLGIEPDTLLSIIFGATFDWGDMVAYIVGGCVCLVVERLMKASVSVH